MDMSKGLPRGNRSKKLPAPFTRPSVSVTRDRPRVWRQVFADTLEAGDTVSGWGVVVEREWAVDAQANSVLRVKAGHPEGQWREPRPGDVVLAFVRS